MSALIAASSIKTCLGDGEATFAALLSGRSGISALRYVDGAAIHVAHGYHIAEPDDERPFRGSAWLGDCVRDALTIARIDPCRQRVLAVVGTGLGELRAVELQAITGAPLAADTLHYTGSLQHLASGVEGVLTISNACSAAGHALALAQDLIEAGEADAVIVGGVDAMTESMLTMIGRVADTASDHVRPFDAQRMGVLLGEGAAAVVLVPEGRCDRPLARLLATAMSCDAYHPTAPDPAGIRRAMLDALSRAGRRPEQVDVVLAHGTGTPLNDGTEASLLREMFGAVAPGPWVTGIKGAVGHSSGGSALASLDVAIRCLRGGVVPPVVGLRTLLPEGQGLRFVTKHPVQAQLRLAQVDAFGFGGVNAITLAEAAV